MVASIQGTTLRNVTIGPVPVPSLFVHDTFTGVNYTALVSHVGEVGAVWTEGPGQTHMILNGQLVGIERSGSDTRCIPSGAVTGNWYFETEIYVNDITNNNDHIQVYQNSDQSFLFFMSSQAMFSEVASISGQFSDGNTYVVRAEFVGSALTMEIDNVIVFTDTVPFSPTGVISFDYFNSFPTTVHAFPTSPWIDQQTDDNYGLHLNYIKMGPL